jgi:hypothetical protein
MLTSPIWLSIWLRFTFRSSGDWLFVFVIVIYFGSLVCGSLLTITDYNYRAVGASGQFSFYIGAYWIWWGIFYNSYASLSFGILYLLYSIWMRAKNDNIGHTAHFVQSVAM